jgi:deoxycytidylate deaminase
MDPLILFNNVNSCQNLLPTFLKRAQRVSLLSDHPQHKLGAVIVQKNKVIAVGRNYIHKTHPITMGHDKTKCKTQHAEITCILRVKNKDKLDGATIVVFRQNKMGVFSIARPCDM